MFYLTAVGGSSQYPSGQRGVVYVRRPDDADWGVLDQVMDKVSEYRICHSVKLVLQCYRAQESKEVNRPCLMQNNVFATLL